MRQPSAASADASAASMRSLEIGAPLVSKTGAKRSSARFAAHQLRATAATQRSCSTTYRTSREARPAFLSMPLSRVDRKSGVEGKRVSVRVDRGGCRILKKKNKRYPTMKQLRQTEETKSSE